VAGAGSVHAETLEVAGATNAAVLDKVSGSGRDPLPASERPLRILIPEAESSMWEYACVRIEFVE
jgi:hypothetical protein